MDIPNIKRIKIPRDRTTNKLKGYAFVELSDQESSVVVKQKINYERIFENAVHVSLIGVRDE